jgi:hypothetical protein
VSKRYKQQKNIAKRGMCVVDGCKRKAHPQGRFVCITCEKKDEDPPFSLQACGPHSNAVLMMVRKHALSAHPVNILRATAAVIKGDALE